MRKLAIAGALAFAALSWAHGARADDAAKERREAADATKAEMKQEGREAQGAMERGAERTKESARAAGERAEARREDAREAAKDKKHPVFGDKSNFDIEGKVQKVSANSITVQREELPAATLTVSKSTKVELDGEAASMKQLRPGQDVKASFNLRGDKPEAVEIKAQKTDRQKDMEKASERQGGTADPRQEQKGATQSR